MPREVWLGIGEVAHWAAALPLVLCFVQMLRHRNPEPNAWLLAGAFCISFLADNVGDRLQAHHVNNWWVSYVYAPIQFGLLVLIVTRRIGLQFGGVVLTLVVAAISAAKGPLTEPETMTQVIIGLVVGWLVRDAKPMQSYRRVVVLYCWGAAPLLFAMAAIPWESVWWPPAWAGYEVVRVVALGLFLRVIWTLPTLRLEVLDGPRAPETVARYRASVRLAGGRHRHAMAASDR